MCMFLLSTIYWFQKFTTGNVNMHLRRLYVNHKGIYIQIHKFTHTHKIEKFEIIVFYYLKKRFLPFLKSLIYIQDEYFITRKSFVSSLPGATTDIQQSTLKDSSNLMPSTSLLTPYPKLSIQPKFSSIVLFLQNIPVSFLQKFL